MTYDLIILGILVFSTVRGAMKGIVWQVAAIAALVLCFVFAAPLSAIVAPYIGIEPPLGRWIAMLVIYLGFSFICFAAARGLRSMIEKMKFEEYDRHVGAIFGFVKGAVLSLVLTFFIVTISASARQSIGNSMSGRAAAIIIDRLHPVMSSEFHDAVEPYIHQLDRSDLDLQYGHDEHEEHAAEGGESTTLDHEVEGLPDIVPGGPTTSAEPPPADPLKSFVDDIAAGLGAELHELALSALRNTKPEDRPELMEKLGSGVPGLIRLFSTEWQDGKPENVAVDERDRLLREIGAVYSDYPQAREAIVEDIEDALVGVPDELIPPILTDWHADLMGFDPDPNPNTGLTTSLDGRILHFLETARVPLNSLEASLKSRLLETLPR